MMIKSFKSFTNLKVSYKTAGFEKKLSMMMKNLKVEDDVSESEGNSKGSQQCRKNIERMEISIPYLDFYPC